MGNLIYHLRDIWKRKKIVSKAIQSIIVFLERHERQEVKDALMLRHPKGMREETWGKEEWGLGKKKEIQRKTKVCLTWLAAA